MKEFLYSVYNAPLMAAVAGWVAAQVIKTFIYFIKHGRLNTERILGAGGMPSSHSATVCALAIVISRIDGVQSTSFAFSMVLALVVMYDASGVRRAAGLHAREINKLRQLIADLDDELIDAIDSRIAAGEKKGKPVHPNAIAGIPEIKKLKEYLGHTPLEVFCGALLGIFIGIVFPVLH